MNERDFDPIPVDKSDYQLPGRRRRNSLEDTESFDESDDESEDNPPVREQMNSVGGDGGGVDASNPNAVFEEDAADANPSRPLEMKSNNTAEATTNINPSKDTNKNINATESPRASSSVSTAAQTSSASATTANADASEVGKSTNTKPSIDVSDESVAEHVRDYEVRVNVTV